MATALAAIPCAYSAHAALAYNPIALPLEKEARAPMWLPQGWKFFTRDAKEEQTFLFRQEADGRWTSADNGRNGEPAHLFGLDRGSRAQGMEYALLVHGIAESEWRDCQVSPETCLADAPEGPRLKNRSTMPTLCGSIGIVFQRPVPWAWAQSGAHPTMPSRVVRARVSC